jgi:uncharacterized membrane protein HdeD (DUF308 family)
MCKSHQIQEQMLMTLDNKLNSSWWALRMGIGLAAFLAGLDKFFDILTNWGMYLSPVSLRLLPMGGTTFMHLVGIVEMIVGLMILTRWTRAGAYIASAWLLLIAVNLLTSGGFFDIAIRDVEIAIAAFVLARMTEVLQPSAGRLPIGRRLPTCPTNG